MNVLIRSQYLPVFSRIGPYRTRSLDQLTFQRRELFEYLGHAASLLPVGLHPLLRWRMEQFASTYWARLRARVERDRPGYVDAVVRQIADRGPLAFSDLADPGKRERVATKYADSTIAWWSWSDGKDVLVALVGMGRLAVSGRRGFERVYDLSERVIPEEIRALPTPSEEDAKRALVRMASAALGVATVSDIADYFRLPVAEARARVRDLVEEGHLQPVDVEGWRDRAYLAAGSEAVAFSGARALLSPFDSLVWDRRRTERLFGFRYRIEIYVPAEKRQHGYFVLPFLLQDSLVGRVDLKADRQRGVLVAAGAFVERGSDAKRVAAELAETLRHMAAWLELEAIEVADRGDLSRHLAPALGRRA